MSENPSSDTNGELDEPTDSAANSAASADAGAAAKDKFRQALERKRGQQSERANETHAESKIHGEHGAAGGRRTFRRKSG